MAELKSITCIKCARGIAENHLTLTDHKTGITIAVCQVCTWTLGSDITNLFIKAARTCDTCGKSFPIIEFADEHVFSCQTCIEHA